MSGKQINFDNPKSNEDWHGNNAAFSCPYCGKIFIVSGLIDKGERKCPVCQKSTGYCDNKSAKEGGTAHIEW